MLGKPLIAWTIEEALKSKYLSCYYVSSDDFEILNVAGKFGAGTIRRPRVLAQDDTPTLPVLQHEVETLESMYAKTFDYIVEIRATSPLKTVADIDASVELLLREDADSVIGVTQLYDHHPQRAKWIDEMGHIRDFIPEPRSGRRQDLDPKAYVRNGTVYALRRDALMGENGKLFGHEKSFPYIMPAERSVNIDTGLDWNLAEILMQERGAR